MATKKTTKKTATKKTTKKTTAKKTTKKTTAKKTTKKTTAKKTTKKTLIVNGHQYKNMTFEDFSRLVESYTEMQASSGRKNFKIFNWTTKSIISNDSTWGDIPDKSEITIEPDDGSGLM